MFALTCPWGTPNSSKEGKGKVKLAGDLVPKTGTSAKGYLSGWEGGDCRRDWKERIGFCMPSTF